MGTGAFAPGDRLLSHLAKVHDPGVDLFAHPHTI
jgi:hypothetical protein